MRNQDLLAASLGWAASQIFMVVGGSRPEGSIRALQEPMSGLENFRIWYFQCFQRIKGIFRFNQLNQLNFIKLMLTNQPFTRSPRPH